jgi:NADH dehydrogenase [ubiquinone] 1 alpha subcomplex assembly factor 5
MYRLLQTTGQRRAYASISNAQINQPFAVFDRNMKRIQRDRAASKNDGEDSRVVDYLRNEVADRMIERLLVSTFSLKLYIHLTIVGYQTHIPVYS